MKKFRIILTLAVLLAVSLLTLAIAEGKQEILIDSSRNAAIKFKGSEQAKGATGNFSFAGDVGKGLVSGGLDMKFDADAAKEIGDAQGALYYTMTDTMEMVGSLDFPLPPEAQKDLQKLTANLESALSDSKAYVNGNFNLEAKTPETVPAVNVDFNAKGDANKFDGKANFSTEGDQFKEVPVKGFEFNIAEKEGATTFTISGSVDSKSPYAEQLKNMAKNPDQIKQGVTRQLQQSGITVDKVELSEYKDENGLGSVTLTLSLKDWRTVVKSGVGMIAQGGKFDAEKFTKAVEQMLEVKFTSFGFKYSIADKALKGEVGGQMENTGKFMLGYYQLVSLISEAQLKEQSGNEPGQQFLLAYQSVAMVEAQKSIQAMVDANMGFDTTGKVTVGTSAEKNLKVDGEFKVDFTNFTAYTEKAKAANLPVAKSACFKMVAGVSDKSRLTGTLYGFADTSPINYYKTLMLETVKKMGAPAEAMAAADKVQFKAGAGAFNLNKEGIKGNGYLEGSELAPLFKLVLDTASQNKFSGELLGFSINGKTEAEKMNVDGAIHFGKFLEGKSADEIKEIMGMPAAEVNDKAKPEDVKLVAVDKPEVAMPAGLQAVADDGKKLIASGNPIASALGGGGGKGGGGLLYILGGLAAVGVVGVGVAAGRKK